MTRWIMGCVAVAAAFSVAGCATPGDGKPAVATPVTSEPTPQGNEQAMQAVRAAADHLASLVRPADPPEVKWLDPSVERDLSATARPPVMPRPVRQVEVVVPEPAPQVTTVKAVEPAPVLAESSVEPAAPPSRQELLDLLLSDLSHSEDPAMQRALQAATLSVLDARYDLDPSLLQMLPPERQRLIRQYQQVLRALHTRLAESPGNIDRRALADELAASLGPVPIEIARLELCRRVKAFGLYDPFDRNVFLVGRENQMIVYCELEHYTPVQQDDGLFRVNLRQEVELYDDSGEVVWSTPAAPIEDLSANRRRDFWTVQLITLPARLTVGKFYLKVRVIDEATGNRAEKSVELSIVADQALVQGSR